MKYFQFSQENTVLLETRLPPLDFSFSLPLQPKVNYLN